MNVKNLNNGGKWGGKLIWRFWVMLKSKCVKGVCFMLVVIWFQVGFGLNNASAKGGGIGGYQGFVEINGTNLYCEVDGGNSPVVVLDSAHGKDHSWTNGLANELRKTEKINVFQYDRAGLGMSGISLDSRTPLNKARELHLLLNSRGITNFYYVGYALSSLTIRAYAYLYPEEIQGVVMLDCVSEEQINGIELFLNSMDVSLMENFKTSFIKEDGDYKELKIGLDQIREIKKYDSFRNVPLTVISGDYHGFGDIFESYGKDFSDGKMMEDKWNEWQNNLASISNKSKYIILDVYYCFQKRTVTRLILEMLGVKVDEKDYVDEPRFFSEGIYRKGNWPLFRFFALMNDGMGW